MEIRAYQSFEELQTLKAPWEDLLRSYPIATTFSTPEWLISWWQTLGKAQRLLVLGFFDQPSRLSALAPLTITTMRVGSAAPLVLLRLLGDGTYDSDNLDLPVRPGFEHEFATDFLNYLDSQRRRWDLCDLRTLPAESPGVDAVLRLLQKNKWTSAVNERPASAIPLPDTWDEYLARLSSEDRKNLTRYARRLEKRYAVNMYRCTSEEQLQPCLEALFRLHQARWTAAGEPGSFGSRERRDFYSELSRMLLQRDLLDMWVLALDGEIASVQFAFRHGRTVFQLQEGNDPERASDRVGFVLRGHVIRELIDQGIRTYDFLGGPLGYKERWGAEVRHYVDLTFARPFSLGSAYLQGHTLAHAGKEWLRRTLPNNAWQTLHNLNLRYRRSA